MSGRAPLQAVVALLLATACLVALPVGGGDAQAETALTALGPVGGSFPIELGHGLDVAGKPAVATDGTNFLIVWRHAARAVRAARVTPDGELLDDPPLALTPALPGKESGYPAVAFDGTNYLVVWAEMIDGREGWELWGRRVTPAGDLLDDPPLQLTTDAGLMPFRMLGIAFGVDHYLVAFRTPSPEIRVVRITPGGENLDGDGIVVGTGRYPAVAFDGERFLVVHHGPGLTLNLQGAFVGQDGVVADGSPFTIAGGGTHEHATVAFNGEVYLAAWYDWRPDSAQMEGSSYAARVATDGTVLDDPPFRLAERVRGQEPVQVTTDGTDFLVVWMDIKTEAGDFRHVDVTARRITSEGTFAEAQPLGVATRTWHDWGPVVGSLGSRHLVAWEGFWDWTAQVRGIVGQLVDTSLPAPPAPTGASGVGGGGWGPPRQLDTSFVSGIIAFAPDDVLAFGEGGTVVNGGVFHHDGADWSVVDAPVGIHRKWAIHAEAPDDIWALGTCGGGLRYRGDVWEMVNCTASAPIGAWADGRSAWTVNADGRILRLDPAEARPWCAELPGCWDDEPTGTRVDLSDVWGLRGDGLVAVGERGTVLRRQGSAWYHRWDDPAAWVPDRDVPTAQRLNAIDGSAPDDVWVVGDAGEILHWDGSAWTRRASGTVADLWDVWAVSPSQAWAVGARGTVLRYDGAGWRAEDSGMTEPLSAVGGVVDPTTWQTHVWVGSDDGRVAHKAVAHAGVPLAVRDTHRIDEDETLVAVAPGVLANDADPEGDRVIPVVDLAPERGALALQADGSFTYTPDANFHGADRFVYHVNDGTHASASVPVQVWIASVVDPPVANADTYTVPPGCDRRLTVPVEEGVLVNDTFVEAPPPYHSVLEQPPAHGVLNRFQQNGAFEYVPNEGFTGADAFTYRAVDEKGQSPPGTVTIDVGPSSGCPAPPPPPHTNDAPAAVDDVAATTPARAVDIDVLSNDHDPDGDPLSVEVAPAAHGTVTIVEGGAGGSVVRYLPDPGFGGVDTFRYTVTDPAVGRGSASVHVAVGEASVALHAHAGQTVVVGGAGAGPPLSAEVTLGDGGPLALAVHAATSAVSGWRVPGWAVDVVAPAASPEQPLRLVLRADASAVPPGHDPAAAAAFRNETEAPPCAGAGAVPDPCLLATARDAGGALSLTVLTSTGSRWTVGAAPTGRFSGASRIERSVAVSRGVFASSPTAVLARADQFADALAGAPLAARLGAPLLLTNRGSLNPAVRAELARLGVRSVVLLGGTAALAETVADDLRAAGVAEVDRVGGSDRFDTARRIALRVGGVAEAYIALGAHADPSRAWPDALAVSGLAAHQRRPLLLVATEALPAATARALEELGIRRATIVGGAGAVAPAVEAALRDRGIATDRIAGATRYATSAAIAGRMLAAGMNPVRTWFASGGNWPDALSAGPAAGSIGAPVLLIDPADLGRSGATRHWVAAHAHLVAEPVIVGGRSAVSPAVEEALRAVAGA